MTTAEPNQSQQSAMRAALANVIKSVDSPDWAGPKPRPSPSSPLRQLPEGSEPATAHHARQRQPVSPAPAPRSSPRPKPAHLAPLAGPEARAQQVGAGSGKAAARKVILCTYSYMTDDELLKSNMIVFAVNLSLWLPFIGLGLAQQYREPSQELRNAVWWLATLNCCSCSYIYALTNKDFREAFNKLFYYCCCKSHVTFQRKTPIFRRQLDVDSKGNLRVHIIPGLNLYSNKLARGPETIVGGGLGASELGLGLGHHHHHHHVAGHVAPHRSHLQHAARQLGAHSLGDHLAAPGAARRQAGQQQHQVHRLRAGFGGPLFSSAARTPHAGPAASWQPDQL